MDNVKRFADLDLLRESSQSLSVFRRHDGDWQGWLSVRALPGGEFFFAQQIAPTFEEMERQLVEAVSAKIAAANDVRACQVSS